jgi:DNA-directed RNA polymerase subunit E'/Rpb7
MNIQTPYINTHLYSVVGLYPSQFDNEIDKHLKENLIRKLQGKCYKNYGFISRIYKIDERLNGELIAENPFASALYKVKFSCKICRPLKGTIIVCEVVSINKSLIYLKNGPINLLIFEENGSINQNNFIFDDRKNVLIAKIGGGQFLPVVVGTFVEVKITASRLEHNSNRIMVAGTLENIASKKAIAESIEHRENDRFDFVNYDDYIEDERNYYKKDEFEDDESTKEESDDESLKSDSGSEE